MIHQYADLSKVGATQCQQLIHLPKQPKMKEAK